MTRENRLILGLIGIGIAGVGALAFLAHHLQSAPRKSVHDLSAPAAESAMVPPRVNSAPVAAGRGQAAVEAYLAARQASGAVLAQHPYKAKHIEAMVTGDYDSVKGQKVGADLDILTAYKTARFDALEKSGGSEAEYEAVRAAYRQWKTGAPVDDALVKAFEARREDLTKVELGRMEMFDDEVK